MRASILTLVASLFLLTAPAPQALAAESATLDPVVKDVLLLVESGVDESVIETWLEKRGARPSNLGVDELIALKDAKVSDSLVKQLVLLSMSTEENVPRDATVPSVAARPAPPPRESVPEAAKPEPRVKGTADKVREMVNPLASADKLSGGSNESARGRLVNLLVSDAIQRVRFEGTSIEAVASRVDTAVARILEDGTGLGDSPEEIADLAEQIILGINDHQPNLEERTFGTNASNIVVDNVGEAKVFGNMVNLLGGIFLRAAQGAEDRFSARATTRRMLDQFVVDPSAMDFPILFQYEENLKNLAMEPTSALQPLLVAR